MIHKRNTALERPVKYFTNIITLHAKYIHHRKWSEEHLHQEMAN